jgi:hypothetical protein
METKYWLTWYKRHREEYNFKRRQNYAANREQQLLRHKDYRENNREKIRKQSAKYREEHKEEIRQKLKLRARRKREELIFLLGGKCCMCGENDRRCLDVEHKNGDGGKERKEKGSGAIIEYYLKHPEEAKERLQCMCANCHRKKTYENGENGYKDTQHLNNTV